MQKFEYRAPRFAVDLQARLTAENSTVAARCREISEGGMTLDFTSLLPPDSLGIVSVNYNGKSVELQARVVHAGARHCGLKFIYESEDERRDMAIFIEFLAASQNPAGYIPARPDPGFTSPVPPRPVSSEPVWEPSPQRFGLGTGRRA
jgi:hypothetical protein